MMQIEPAIRGKMMKQMMSIQTELLNRKSDNRQIFIEFLFKLSDIADIINALVKSACKLRRYRLRVDTLISDRR